MISKFSVKKPYTVLVGVVLAIILGVVSFTRMTADLLPSISLPYVIVMTTYPGASPETVETVVTQPVEASMATVSNIESISSVSSENYSLVILEFAQTADMNAVSLEIRESLDQISSYWDDTIGNPIIMKLNPDMLPIMIAAVGMEGMDYGEISTYVQNTIMPELESIEGVASVSATGLLEESVNVIIRRDKVDEINKKVFAAVDDQMAEAEQQLADARQEIEDGRKEIEDGRKELVDGRKELINGRKELEDGKQGLEDGRKELEEQQNALNEELATQKNLLMTAKAQLEKMQTDLATAKQLNDGIGQIDAVLAQVAQLESREQLEVIKESLSRVSGWDARYAGYIESWREAGTVSGGDADSQNQRLQAERNINVLRLEFQAMDSLSMLAMLIGSDAGLSQLVDDARELDYWYPLDDDDQSVPAIVGAALGGLHVAADQMLGMLEQLDMDQLDALREQRDNLNTALMALTNGLGYDAYYALIFNTLSSQGIRNMADLADAINGLNSAIVEIEKGQLTAAIEFANGKTTIALGEYQLELAEAQLDALDDQLQSGLDQMDDALSQLDDAEDQIAEGEEQLADAKESAYEKADMTNVLTVDTIKGLLTAQNFSMPAGYVTEEGVNYLVRVGDKPSTVEELQVLPLMDLHMDGVPVITLGDVADVFYTDNSADIYTNVDGSAGVMLTIQKQTGYSTGDVSDRLGERFEELMEETRGLTLITLMDQGIYIDLVMDSIINNILFGAVLAILILLVFLKDVRPTLVVTFSIPISLVTAVVCMYFSGVTLNIISLSGLALGIGMLVDNSIVVIENIFRMRGEGKSVQEAAIEGAREVGGAIMASTLTTICVFLPIVFTEGITRQLFVDMGLTIAYSLLASLVIALTVVPALSSKMLSSSKEQKQGRILERILNGYEKLLKGALRVKPLVLVLVLVLLAASVAMAFTNGTAFMADMDSTQLTVSVRLGEEATLQETGEVTDRVVEAIMSIEDVKNVGAMTSSSTVSLLGGGGGSTNSSTIYVVTEDDKDMSNEDIARLIQEKTAGLDAEITVDTSSMDMSALGGSGISIQVRGRELDTIQRIAQEVAAILESVEGTTEVSDGLDEADEELRIIIDRNEAVHYGLTVAQVFTQIYAKLAAASSATTLVAADKDYNVYVMNGNDIELTRELVKELEITGTDEDGASTKIPLSKIADFETTLALASINRTDQTRYVSVSAAIAKGYNVGLVAADVEDRLADYEVPAGYQLVFSGENEMIVDAMEQIMLMLLLAVVFIYLIMVAQFQSLLSPFIIMFTIPLAFTGGFLGLFITGSEVSVIAMIGFVMLSGIIVNNGIVIIDYMNQLRQEGMDKRQAILTAGRTRLRPVLMTALTTILALSTMVFSQEMGSEMAKPMAVVTIGGLLYGTLLTLVVIPCIYDIFIRESRGRKERKLWHKSKRAPEDDLGTL